MINTRRAFIKTVAATTATLPLFAIGKPGIAATEKLNFAAVGVGGRGFADIKGMMRSGQVNLIAVADVDAARSANFRNAFPEVKVYTDWRELLDKEGDKLDLISVATPDHMHAPVGVEAMRMGIPVYGEKPLAHTLKETRYMTELAKETGLVTQMGTQYATTMYERMAVQMIQEGVIGKVKEVYAFCHKKWGDIDPLPDRQDPVPNSLNWDLWLGVAESRPYIGQKYFVPGQWRKRLDFGTGTLGDMGCHILGPVYRALGGRNPLSVKSVGAQPNTTNWAIDEKIEYMFPGSDVAAGKTVKVTWCDGSLRPPKELTEIFGPKMKDQGTIWVGSEGYLLVPFKGVPIPYPREQYKGFRYPKLPKRDHFDDFIAAVKGRGVKPIADFCEYGGPLTESVLIGALASHFPNETLDWDAKELRFTNSNDANQLVTKSYRNGWEIKGLI